MAAPQNRFEILPTEISFMILENLRKKDLRKFAWCSKLCYNLCLPFRFKGIILTPDVIRLFDRGGLCEHARHHIHSVRFEKPWDWQQGINDFTYGEKIEDLKRLYISYKIYPSIENNLYAAIIGGIAKNTSCHTLRLLEFQIYRTIRAYSDFEGIVPYKKIYSELSLKNQEFLGDGIPDDEIEDAVRDIAPKLPALTVAKISVNRFATPLAHPKSKYLERSAFYYIPLTLAPGLRRLHVNTTESKDYLELYKFHKEDTVREDFDAGFLDNFLTVTDLKILKHTIPREEELQMLIKRFPNLKILDIGLFNRCERDLDSDRPTDNLDHRYDEIGMLKHLKEVKMPWPGYNNTGSVSTKDLENWVNLWLKGGLNRLKTVTFKGAKYNDPNQEWEDIEVSITVKRKKGKEGWTLATKGDTSFYIDDNNSSDWDSNGNYIA
ncbi:hypothetical protein ABW20_dc0104112 [Dactylellina cionopaga]|nr:hypothetical protein ABW20_dc0104112 [Dactylellina cionopaga]